MRSIASIVALVGALRVAECVSDRARPQFAVARLSPVSRRRATHGGRSMGCVMAYQELRPHEKNFGTQIKHTIGKGFTGTGRFFNNLGSSVQLRFRKFNDADTAYSYDESMLIRRSDKDLTKVVLSAFLFTRPVIGDMAIVLLNIWPSAFLPSTFEDTEDRFYRYKQKNIDKIEVPITVVSQFKQATRQHSVAYREKHDKFVEAAESVLSSKSKSEALAALDSMGYLAPPEKKGFFAGNPLGSLPWQLVKAGHKAVTQAPRWMPSLLTRGVLIDHVIDITRNDELLKAHLGDLSRDELIIAAQDRGLPGTLLDDAQLRSELQNWLTLVEEPEDGVASRDPLKTRLALVGINTIESARANPENSEFRILFGRAGGAGGPDVTPRTRPARELIVGATTMAVGAGLHSAFGVGVSQSRQPGATMDALTEPDTPVLAEPVPVAAAKSEPPALATSVETEPIAVTTDGNLGE